MGDMLSQAEIDALLNGTSFSGMNNIAAKDDLTAQEIDALGEIGNISMGTSATTLFTLLGQKVNITTPNVTITSWDEMSNNYRLPLVAVRVEYTNGLVGSNFLILKETDAKIITDLMMGGDGSNTSSELSDLHLSAISEAMNQMIGSSATSMSSMFDKRIDISPPKAFVMKFESGQAYYGFDDSQKIVKIAFRMIIGDLVDSEIMQLLPLSFAKNLVDNLLHSDSDSSGSSPSQSRQPADLNKAPQGRQNNVQSSGGNNQQYFNQNNYSEPVNRNDDYDVTYKQEEKPRNKESVNVQPVQFQTFDEGKAALERKNISLIMDVPLQVTVELGRTHKLIKDILEFGPGSIIELDKLAGEPVDILVNGKSVAKGEVVVIDESFGVRITDIIHPSKRL